MDSRWLLVMLVVSFLSGAFALVRGNENWMGIAIVVGAGLFIFVVLVSTIIRMFTEKWKLFEPEDIIRIGILHHIFKKDKETKGK